MTASPVAAAPHGEQQAAFVDPTDPGYDVEVLREHVRHLERRVMQLSAAAALQQERIKALEAALSWAIHKIDSETCTHEDTYRAGSIWTICRMCHMKWADDRGGFKPYEEPKELTAARDLL